MDSPEQRIKELTSEINKEKAKLRAQKDRELELKLETFYKLVDRYFITTSFGGSKKFCTFRKGKNKHVTETYFVLRSHDNNHSASCFTHGHYHLGTNTLRHHTPKSYTAKYKEITREEFIKAFREFIQSSSEELERRVFGDLIPVGVENG